MLAAKAAVQALSSRPLRSGMTSAMTPFMLIEKRKKAAISSQNTRFVRTCLNEVPERLVFSEARMSAKTRAFSRKLSAKIEAAKIWHAVVHPSELTSHVDSGGTRSRRRQRPRS